MSAEMWTLFEQYQSFADAKGHGESWRRMTQDRTRELLRNAADDAAKAAEAAGSADAARAAEWAAAYAAANAAWAAENAYAYAAWCENRAIEYIERAIKGAQSWD